MRPALTATDGHIDRASIILRATAGPPAARRCTSTQSQLRSEPQSSPIFPHASCRRTSGHEALTEGRIQRIRVFVPLPRGRKSWESLRSACLLELYTEIGRVHGSNAPSVRALRAAKRCSRARPNADTASTRSPRLVWPTRSNCQIGCGVRLSAPG
jgi:hypothetical protein